MTDPAVLSAILAIPYFWQAILLVFAVLALGLLALVVRVARLNRNITVLEMRVTTLESRPLQPAPLPQKTALLKKTSLADGPSQNSAADAIIPEFLTLLQGTIDCPDIPLNVSRSYLQNDRGI